MEPLKPETIKDLLNRPHVAPADIEEYQRLLAERFSTDPDAPQPPGQAAVASDREARLEELYEKLFGNHVPVTRQPG